MMAAPASAARSATARRSALGTLAPVAKTATLRQDDARKGLKATVLRLVPERADFCIANMATLNSKEFLTVRSDPRAR